MNTTTPPTLDPRSRRLQLPDLTLHYTDTGSGPRTLLLLHGYTDSHRSFDLILPRLAPHARCIALDQRGHGLSSYSGPDFSLDAYTRDAIDLIEHLGLSPVTIVGHSMGSLIARKVALARPDLIDRLILVGSAPSADTPAVRDLGAALSHFRGHIPRDFVRDFQTSCIHDPATVPAPFFNECVDHGVNLPSHVWHLAFAGMRDDDHTRRLHEITHPTLIVGGTEDSAFPVEDQRRLASALPNAELLLYANIGHTPHWECPARFTTDTLRFLAAAAPAPSRSLAPKHAPQAHRVP